VRYEIQVEGIVDQKWSTWFDDMHIKNETGDGSTIEGEVPDQAALHGLLARVRDLGLVVISVTRIDHVPETPPQQTTTNPKGDTMTTHTPDEVTT